MLESNGKSIEKHNMRLGQGIVEFLKVTGIDFMDLYKGEREQTPEDIAQIHAFNMFKTAEGTESSGDVRSTSSNFSESEYPFISHFFSTFYGLSERWVAEKFLAYQLSKHPEARKASKEIQKMHSGFRHFFESLPDEIRFTIFGNIDQRMADSELQKFPLEDQERITQYMNENKNCNWRIIYDMLSFWHIDSTSKFNEAMACSYTEQPRRIERNEHSTKLVKDLVHTIVKDGKIDPLEKEIARVFLGQRFDGFDELTGDCIDRVLEDITRKDMLFYFALSGMLDGVSLPSLDVGHEIREVLDKTEKAKALLGYFGDRGINSEELALVSYAMRMVGIRGKSNLGLVLEGYAYNREDMNSLQLYDVPVLDMYIKNSESIKNCGIKDLEILAKLNPRLEKPTYDGIIF